jgi:hypothetical protein
MTDAAHKVFKLTSRRITWGMIFEKMSCSVLTF